MAERDDSPAALLGDAEVLHDAMAILRNRWPNHKYDDTAAEVRKAAVHLISIARHPSRQHLRGGRMYVPPVSPDAETAERIVHPGGPA